MKINFFAVRQLGKVERKMVAIFGCEYLIVPISSIFVYSGINENF